METCETFPETSVCCLNIIHHCDQKVNDTWKSSPSPSLRRKPWVNFCFVLFYVLCDKMGGSWAPNILSVSCEVVVCEKPAPLLHGFMEGDSYNYGDVVLYSCLPGFELKVLFSLAPDHTLIMCMNVDFRNLLIFWILLTSWNEYKAYNFKVALRKKFSLIVGLL